MYKRMLEAKIKQLFSKFPAVAILGPRQSGKTTLAKTTFTTLPCVNLERLSDREFASQDPEGFLATHPNGLIIDEIQHVPSLLSYLQVKIDEIDRPSQYVLTGSQNLFLSDKIAQTLAGRIALTNLLPLTYAELGSQEDALSLIYKGFYPRLHKEGIDPQDFYPSYIQTYVEKDVRQIQNISNLGIFQRFLKHCAGRVGQLLNLESLGNDCGISHTTARQWLSILELSYIVYSLQPYHTNFNKRLVKSHKLYFYDTGIACSLLDINAPSVLETHYLKGALFENLIIMDTLKKRMHQGLKPHLYFWRDKTGHEIDMLDEKGTPFEIKSGQTVVSDFFDNLTYFQNLKESTEGFLIYGGKDTQKRKNATVLGWQDFLKE